MRHPLLAVTGIIAVLGTAPVAFAAPPQAGLEASPGAGAPVAPKDADEATRNAARKIAEEGLALFEKGQWTEALDRFERAGSLVRAPTMGLMAARSLVKLGRLVEASERYLGVTRMELDAGASDAFRKAQVDAGKEREALQARIPSLHLTVGGAGDASVTLDGKPLPAALVGAAFPVDPGPHVVVVTRDRTSKTERFQLREGEERRLAITLDVAPPPTSGLKVAGIAGVALGGAGLVVGAVAGGIALSTNSELAAVCKPGCPPSEKDKLAGYETTKALTTSGLVVGGVLLGAGALMIGLAPSSPSSGRAASSPAVVPLIGAGSAGVKVVF